MNSYIFELINENLFPKLEHKSSYIIQLSELFTKALLEEYKKSHNEIPFDLIKLRQIIYGLASTKKNTGELIEAIKSFLSKNYLRHEINSLIDLLKKEKIKVEAYFDYNLYPYFIKIDDWQSIINNDFNFSAETLRMLRQNDKENIITDISPKIIKSELENYYFGPDNVKEELCRLFYEQFNKSISSILHRRNILIIGPSGCGKTFIINKIADIVKQPFISYDTTKMSRTGIVGDKVEDILALLYSKAGSLEKMKNGIIFLDEIDKLAANLQYGDTEVSSTGVQIDLLKFIEGGKYSFSPAGHRDYDRKSGVYEIDSSDLLIICGGAFTGIDKIIEKRIKKNKFGFVDNAPFADLSDSSIGVEDLIDYGLLKEFAARFPIIIPMPDRNVDDLYNILVNTKDSLLKNYIEYFKLQNCNLIIEDDAAWEIARCSFKQTTGARGLVRILEKVLPMYSVANKEMTEFRLTKNIVNEKLNTNS